MQGLVAQEPHYNKGTPFGASYFIREPRNQRREKGTTGLPRKDIGLSEWACLKNTLPITNNRAKENQGLFRLWLLGFRAGV